MLDRFITGLGIMIVSVGVTTVVLFDHFTGRLPFSKEPADGTLSFHVDSEVLGERRELLVWLPQNYDATERYPVIYALDGGSLGVSFADITNVLSSGGFTSPTIVVGIPNLTDRTRKRDLTPPMLKQEMDEVNSPQGEGDAFIKFLAEEVIPFVEQRYPSNQRLLAGHSRGGLLVLYSMMANPELFDGRICFSAPFWRQDALLINEFSKFLAARDSLPSFLYVSAGDLEKENIRKGVDDLSALLTASAPAGLVWHTRFTPGADHQENATGSIPSALKAWANFANPIPK